MEYIIKDISVTLSSDDISTIERIMVDDSTVPNFVAEDGDRAQ